MKKALCRILIVLMAWAPFHLAQAGMIGTDQLVASSAQSDRAAVLAAIGRAEVAAQLQALGLDPASAKDRVAAMSDEDVSALAGRLNSLPAGGTSSGAAAVILIVLIVLLAWWATGGAK